MTPAAWPARAGWPALAAAGTATIASPGTTDNAAMTARRRMIIFITVPNGNGP